MAVPVAMKANSDVVVRTGELIYILWSAGRFLVPPELEHSFTMARNPSPVHGAILITSTISAW